MAEVKLKIKYSEIEKKSKEELLELKKKFELHNLNTKSRIDRSKGYSIKTIKRNIARINQRLGELK